MNREDLKIIQQNVPEVSDELIYKMYEDCHQDIMETICKLLEIPSIEKTTTEWEKRREICDNYDSEMQTLLKNMRNSGLEDNGVLNIPVAVPELSRPSKKIKIETIEEEPVDMSLSLPPIVINPKFT